MSLDESILKELNEINEETEKVSAQIEAYTRKLMTPVWNKRREVVKKIPNFWTHAIGNSAMFGAEPSENDVDALENLTDFHVEYDENRPNYRKVTATFKKNDTFKNETLTKEFEIDQEDGNSGKVLSKSTIDYHSGKAPNAKKRKAGEEEDDDFTASFLQWFEDDSIIPGIMLSEEIFPAAVESYQNNEDEDEDADEIELGSEDEDEDEEEENPKKKQKK
ncbi:hypothetical protein VTP01DRAFT_2660 [Rhizomucor pusillus]|uniref:uncharacterized protein n=1 Tax=Rhizomucor pusillus TaxID=4840 RepID=UPI0037434F37